MIAFVFIVGLATAKPSVLPAHRVAVSDGGEIVADRIEFAVVGNTRAATPTLDKGRSIQGHFADEVVGDIFASNVLRPLTFLVHTGDMVPHSSGVNWASFGDQFSGLVDGTTQPTTSAQRIPILPVAGDRDCAKDSSCTALSAAFPGWGTNIGFGRFATWQSVTMATTEGLRYKVLVLDSNKKALGSRWQEQTSWLALQAQQPESGLILLVHEPLHSLNSTGRSSHTGELVEIIENHAPLLSIKAIFSGGPSASQALLPDGIFGLAQFVAGGGGAPADDLNRGVAGGEVDQIIAPGFHEGVEALLDAYEASENPPSSRTIQEGRGRGAFSGYPRRLVAAEIPTHGWWRVQLSQVGLGVTWRAMQPDRTFRDQSSWSWTPSDGWQPNSTAQD